MVRKERDRKGRKRQTVVTKRREEKVRNTKLKERKRKKGKRG